MDGMTDTAARLDRIRNALNRIVRISVDPDVTRIAERALEDAAHQKEKIVAGLEDAVLATRLANEIDGIYGLCSASMRRDRVIAIIAPYVAEQSKSSDAEATSSYLNQPCRTKLECATAIASRARDSLPLSPDARAMFDRIVTILDEVRR